MQFLIVHLKDVGKFLAILILILQLTSCGGTFPVELVPGFFNICGPFMPMTYSVNVFKESISGVDRQWLIHNLLVLASIMCGFLLLSTLFFHGKRIRSGEKTEETMILASDEL
jgi:putative membrane protein